jgi:hypothetical protein
MKLQKFITRAIFAGALVTTIGCLGLDEDEAKEALGLSPDEQAELEGALEELDPEDKVAAEKFSNNCKVLLGALHKAEKIDESDNSRADKREQAQGKLVKECHKEIPDDFEFPEEHHSGEAHEEKGINISDKCDALAHGAPEVFMEECFDEVVANNKPGSLDENCSSLYQGVWDEMSKLVTEDCIGESDSESAKCEERNTAAGDKTKAFYDDCEEQAGEGQIFPNVGNHHDPHHHEPHHNDPHHHDDEPKLSPKCNELKKAAETSQSEADIDAFIKDCQEEIIKEIHMDFQGMEISKSCNEGIEASSIISIKNHFLNPECDNEENEISEKCEELEEPIFELMKDCPHMDHEDHPKEDVPTEV